MSAGSGGLARATIRNNEGGGVPIECLFNPNEYTFSKSNNWSMGQVKGKNMPRLEFSVGQPATLQMQLFFDTWSKARDGAEPEDVRAYTYPIWDLMRIDPKLADKKHKLGRPPSVHFQWGESWSFDAVITQITMKYTMFHSNGAPVRATMDVTFQQYDDPQNHPRQNPTSGGRDGGRLWTVREGDTLAWIAHREYGDPNLWRRIADANRLTEVRRLRPGTVLEVPGG